MIQDLLETSLAGTDEELATLTDQMHPRAVRKVAEFLKILKNNRAQVKIGLNRREVALRDHGEVERAVNRLALQNIREETTTTTGTLISIVPARRFFKFRISDTGEFMEGRIGQEIHDPYRVAARYANREVRARIRRLQVGQGQPKYTLLEMLGTDGRPRVSVKPGNRLPTIPLFLTQMVKGITLEVASRTPFVTRVATE